MIDPSLPPPPAPLPPQRVVLYGGPMDGWSLTLPGAATRLSIPQPQGRPSALYLWSLDRNARGRRLFKLASSLKPAALEAANPL